MEDQDIIALYFARSERAIGKTQEKYGRMLQSIALGILRSRSDAEECENDTYLQAWNSMPPARPSVLSAFLSRITRNLSLDRYDKLHAQKRGGGEIPLILDELSECIPDRSSDDLTGEKELSETIDQFLSGLSRESRVIFMRRYWFGDTVKEIALKGGFGLSKVKMSLSRSRKELKKVLEKEGYVL